MHYHPRPSHVLFCFSVLSNILILTSGQWPQPNDDDEPVTTVGVDAIEGRSVAMPCDIEPVDREDRVHMVLWFREKGGKPLYSFDVRGRSFAKAGYWSDENAFGGRAYFQTVSKPAALSLDGVTVSDEGVYRCRVDFKNSPTRNYQVNLTVIVPPRDINVYDANGKPVTHVIGPLNEGANLILKCEVRGVTYSVAREVEAKLADGISTDSEAQDNTRCTRRMWRPPKRSLFESDSNDESSQGKPSPTVSWMVNDKLTAATEDLNKDGQIVTKLEVHRVSRELLNSTYKCQASNSKLTTPLEKTATLELYLKPLSAKILEKPKPLLSGKEYQIACEAEGSRPPAEVTWWRENRRLKRWKTSLTLNGTLAISHLSFTPTSTDNGVTLKCTAVNPNISGSIVEDSFLLDVVYAPEVTLRLGNTLKADDIKEGGDVYFECNIRANPKEHKITWFHNEHVVTHNISSGVILSTKSLVLQGVSRQDSGTYSCLAANVRGERRSDPVRLRVQYAPVCQNEEAQIVGASLDESVRVRCHVTADPADVAFVWQFNNSGEHMEVAPTRFGTANSSTSELTYSPTIERDYGTLACWGRNVIGRQLEPCVFHIVPAARPGSLRNCTLRATNSSQDVYDVDCVPGHDGGLTQHFVLEAYESRTMRLRLNLSSDVPIFRIDLSELLPTTSYTPVLHIVLFAVNSKGRGESFILEDIALKDAEKRTESVLGSTSGLSAVPIAALLCGTGLVIGLAVLLIVVIAVRRRRQTPPVLDLAKQKNSLVEINDGDRRYVVSYTLKSPADCRPDHHEKQPDILSAPRGTSSAFAESPPRRPENLFFPSDVITEDCHDVPRTLANVDVENSSYFPEVLTPRSDGTIRQTREGTLPRMGPSREMTAALPKPLPSRDSTLPRSLPPRDTNALPPRDSTLPRATSIGAQSLKSDGTRTLNRPPIKSSRQPNGSAQVDPSLVSIPGPESCV